MDALTLTLSQEERESGDTALFQIPPDMFATARRKQLAVGLVFLAVLLGLFLWFNRIPKLDIVEADLAGATAPAVECFQGFCLESEPDSTLFSRWWDFSLAYLKLISLGMVFAFLHRRVDRDIPAADRLGLRDVVAARGARFLGRPAGWAGHEPLLCLHRPHRQRLPAAGRGNGGRAGHRPRFQHSERAGAADGRPGVHAHAGGQPGRDKPDSRPVPRPPGGLAGRAQPERRNPNRSAAGPACR